MKRIFYIQTFLAVVLLFLQAVPSLAYSREITLKEAGTLSSYIPISDYSNVTDLKLGGPINGSDIKVLRNLPKLQELDLSGATIVNGGAYYYNYTTTQKLLGSTIYYRDFYFSGSKNSNEQSSKPPYEHEYRYYRNNLENAFLDNTSLKIIHFPTAANTESIGAAAFTGCSNLETIYIGGNIKSLSSKAFRRCGSLKNVNVTNSLYFVKMDDGCIYGAVAGKKKPLAFVPPAQKTLVIPEFVDSISWEAFPGTFDIIYIESRDIKNAAKAFSKNETNTETPVYAYHEMAEKLGKYFSNIKEYGMSITLSENAFNRLSFTLDTILGPNNKNAFALKSVTCNDKPCSFDAAKGVYVIKNAGLDERKVVVTYVLGGTEYTVQAEYPAVSPQVSIDKDYNVSGQTYVGTRVVATSDDNLKPSEIGVVFDWKTKKGCVR